MPAPETRLWQKVDRRGPDECWLWLASDNGSGYGQISVADRMVLAHRFAYELMVGPIPEGMTLDHLCRTPRCVNPAHLEPVTMRENTLRGDSKIAKQARQTHCVHGHRFDQRNTYTTPNGRRQCRTCRRATSTDWARQQRRVRACL